MPTITTTLLDFLMSLFQNPEAAADFDADPESALSAAGLSGVCTDDVAAVLPSVLDHAGVTAVAGAGGGVAWAKAAAGAGGGHGGGNGGGGVTGGGNGGGGWADDHAHAVQQITTIANSY